MDPAELDALGTFAAGGELDPKKAKALFDKGLVETADDGSFRVTPTGREFYNAAGRGDAGAARDAISRGTDATGRARDREEQRMAREDARAKTKAEREKAKADKEAQQKKGGGGGGGGGKDKPTDDEKQAAREKAKSDAQQKQRATVRQQMMDNDEGLAPAGFDALMGFADGDALEGPAARALSDMGIVEGEPPRLTPSGRMAVNAINRGNVRGAVDAIGAAQDRKRKADEAAQRKADAEAEKNKKQPAKPADEGRPLSKKRAKAMFAKPVRHAKAAMVEAQGSLGGYVVAARFRRKRR